MQTVKRRCAQTAHISLHSFNFQRARTQNKQHTRTSGVLPSCIQNFVTSVSTRAPFRPSASLRLFVFGEALSRVSRRDPQEEKCKHPSFSRHTQCLLGFFTAAAASLGSLRKEKRRKSGPIPESAPLIRVFPPRILPNPRPSPAGLCENQTTNPYSRHSASETSTASWSCSARLIAAKP